MALSDREQAVLNEMELDLHPHVLGPAPVTNHRASWWFLTAALGMFTTGVVALAVGLSLKDNLGTSFGVLGFVLITGAGCSMTQLAGPLGEWMSAHNGTRIKPRPSGPDRRNR